MEVAKLRYIFLVSFSLLLPSILADIADFDETWRKRAEDAQHLALEAYNPDPFNVTFQTNMMVNKATELLKGNGTRRNLRKYNGPCMATNPIDRCWRCHHNWAKDRKRLARCVLGFGRMTRGGVKGRYYLVTDPSDHDIVNPKPGTLRHAVIQTEPLWIIFKGSMIIKLKEELMINSHKTIDGRGANVHIAYGAGITVQFVRNVIIHGLHIHDTVPGSGGMIRDSLDHVGLRTRSDGDGISVYGSVNVWLDHLSMRNCQDGLIDVIESSTAITISNCHFTHHNDVLLFGASDFNPRDKVMQITVAFNHFGQGLIQRMPRCRWGFFHVLNNDYTHWLMYAIGGSSHPTIISQGNRFIAPDNRAAKEVTKREKVGEEVWRHWTWRSEGDLMMNGAFFLQSGHPHMHLPFGRKHMITAKPASFVTRLTRFAGKLDCKVGKPC